MSSSKADPNDSRSIVIVHSRMPTSCFDACLANSTKRISVLYCGVVMMIRLEPLRFSRQISAPDKLGKRGRHGWLHTCSNLCAT